MRCHQHDPRGHAASAGEESARFRQVDKAGRSEPGGQSRTCIRDARGYLSTAMSYGRAVSDLNRLIGQSGASGGRVRLALSDYQHSERSPVRAADLLRASEEYEDNPFTNTSQKEFRYPAPWSCTWPEIAGVSLNYLSQALTAFSDYGFYQGQGANGGGSDGSGEGASSP